MLQDLKDDLKQELDFELEGKHGERCAVELKALKYIHVPKIMWQYTNKVWYATCVCLDLRY